MPNTLKQNVDRVKAAKTAIGNAIIAKGGTVSVGDGLEDFADAIATIPAGGDDSGHFIKEALPITFNGDGNNLDDYIIYGKRGGLNGICPNVYPPINDNSIHRGYWGEWYTYERYLPDEPAYNRAGAWQGLCNEVYLDVGTYTLSVYVKTEDVTITNGVTIYIVEVGDFPKYSQAATVTLPGTTTPTVGTTLETVTNSWQRYTFTFDITTAGYVAPRVEKRNDDGTNIIVTCYQLEKGATASPYVAYNTTGITINVNDSIIFFPLDEPLGPNDTLTMADTGVNIPTVNGVNVIDTPIDGKFDMKIKGGISTIPIPEPANTVSRYVNFSNNTYASFGNVATHPVYSAINRCNVSDDGTINAFYGDNDYVEDGSNGQVMVYIPKFYYKVTPDNNGGLDGVNIRKCMWSISDSPDGGYTLHPAFYDANGNEIDYFLYGAFEAIGQRDSTYGTAYNTSTDKLSSVAGSTSYFPTVSMTRATARTMAANRGTGWYQVGVKQTMAVQMLIAIEYGFNVQDTIGNGVTNDTDSPTYVGRTTGNITSGTKANQYTPVNWRGIENMWGNVNAFIDGINSDYRTPYICNTYDFADETSTGYTQIAFDPPALSWMSAFGYDPNNPWVFLSSEVASSPTNAVRDQCGSTLSSTTGWYGARFGGRWVSGDGGGIFNVVTGIGTDDVDTGSGARLMYIPSAS